MGITALSTHFTEKNRLSRLPKRLLASKQHKSLFCVYFFTYFLCSYPDKQRFLRVILLDKNWQLTIPIQKIQWFNCTEKKEPDHLKEPNHLQSLRAQLLPHITTGKRLFLHHWDFLKHNLICIAQHFTWALYFICHTVPSMLDVIFMILMDKVCKIWKHKSWKVMMIPSASLSRSFMWV